MPELGDVTTRRFVVVAAVGSTLAATCLVLAGVLDSPWPAGAGAAFVLLVLGAPPTRKPTPSTAVRRGREGALGPTADRWRRGRGGAGCGAVGPNWGAPPWRRRR